jgi:hypothetical protein
MTTCTDLDGIMIANSFGKIGGKEVATARFLPLCSGEMLHTPSARSTSNMPMANGTTYSIALFFCKTVEHSRYTGSKAINQIRNIGQ